MTLFAFIPFIIGAVVETSRFVLNMIQAIRMSDFFSSRQLLKPVALLRKATASLIFYSSFHRDSV